MFVIKNNVQNYLKTVIWGALTKLIEMNFFHNLITFSYFCRKEVGAGTVVKYVTLIFITVVEDVTVVSHVM